MEVFDSMALTDIKITPLQLLTCTVIEQPPITGGEYFDTDHQGKL